MAGTWESQNKVLPGAYINIRTNEPLSITPGDRGTVVILQEMSVGTDGAMYTITATEAAWPDGATASDKKLAAEALKKAKTVLVYKLKASHKAADVTAALAASCACPWIPFQVVLSFCVPTVLLYCSTGISTCCPSATPLGLALGPDFPRADQLYPGNLGYSAVRILTLLSLLIPAFSLLKSPQLLTVLLRSFKNAPLPTLAGSAASVLCFSPGHFRRRTSRLVSYYALF